MKTVLFTLLLCLGCMALLPAQIMPVDTTNGKLYYILLRDGSHIHGRIVRQDSTTMVIRMKSGQLTYLETSQFSQLSRDKPASDTSSDVYFVETTSTRPGQTTAVPGSAATNTYLITLVDGTMLNGVVVSQDSSRVVVQTAAMGTVTIQADRVARMERVGAAQPPGTYTQLAQRDYSNLFPQYLNFLPTAYQAEKGRLYFRNSAIYISQFDYGINENWSVGASFLTIAPTAFGILSTKFSGPVSDRMRLGVQGQYFYGNLGGLGSLSAGFVQGIASIGEPENNVTVGLGFSTGRNASPVVSVSVVRKLRSSLTLISENLLFTGAGSGTAGKLSAGLRFNRARHSFDVSGNIPFGGFLFGGGGTLLFYPLGSYQLRIGR